MPFDPRNANVTVLPPAVADGGPGRRVHFTIEILQQQPLPRSHPVASAIQTVLWFLLLMWVLGCVVTARAADRRQEPQWPWPPPGQGFTEYRDTSGTTWMFPDDLNADRGGGHGCTRQTGGDDVVRTTCW